MVGYEYILMEEAAQRIREAMLEISMKAIEAIENFSKSLDEIQLYEAMEALQRTDTLEERCMEHMKIIRSAHVPTILGSSGGLPGGK